jgi:hypothetical protein
VRFRIDGELREITQPPIAIKDKLASRIKVISRMDIAEKRVPQDGRMKLKFGNKAIDFRVSTLPTLFGEKVVIRILDPSSAKLGIEALGYEKIEKDRLLAPSAALRHDPGHRPHRQRQDGVAVHLPEHPEPAGREHLHGRRPGGNQPARHQPGQRQRQGRADLRRRAEVLPAPGPDIIMVGEIRDLETADIAIKAAQTGHMVMSTLHTNDAPTTLTRLLNMGVAPFNIASSVLLITAQRLARRLCENCKTPADYPREALLKAGFASRSRRQLEAVPGRGLLGVQQRLQGPRRHLPGDADHRSHPAHHPGGRHGDRHRQAGPGRRRARPAPVRPGQGPRGRHHARGSDHRHQRIADGGPQARHRPGRRNRIGRRLHGNCSSCKKRQGRVFEWEGKDRNGKVVRGEIRAGGEAVVSASLRRQGILITKIKKRRTSGGKLDQAEGHRDLHAPAGHHDEGRRAAAAVLRHRRRAAAPTRA